MSVWSKELCVGHLGLPIAIFKSSSFRTKIFDTIMIITEYMEQNQGGEEYNINLRAQQVPQYCCSEILAG